MKTTPATFIPCAIILAGLLAAPAWATPPNSDSESGETKTGVSQPAEREPENSRPATLHVSQAVGGYVLSLDGVDKKDFAKLDLSNAIPPSPSIVIGTQKQRLPVKLSDPKYDPGSRTLIYKVEFLQNSDRNLAGNGGSVHLIGGLCSDGNVPCYGNYQCSGRQCCRVQCGALGITVKYKFHVWTLSCVPESNYSAQCNSQVCNSTNPNPLFGCRQGTCVDRHPCY